MTELEITAPSTTAAANARQSSITLAPEELDSALFETHCRAAGAAVRLQSFDPDVAFAAPSLLPWWKVAASANPKAKDMPFAGWLACNLAPMLKLAAVWDRSRQALPPAPWSVIRLFFVCALEGGAAATSLETSGHGWFHEADVPSDLSLGRTSPHHITRMFAHWREPGLPTEFDLP